MNQEAPTQEMLDEWCRTYRSLLRLDHWDYTVALARRHQLSEEHCRADCEWIAPKRICKIQIIDPIDVQPDDMFPYDPELSVCHSWWLHVLLIDLPTLGEAAMDAEEIAINVLAKILVQQVRDGREP